MVECHCQCSGHYLAGTGNIMDTQRLPCDCRSTKSMLSTSPHIQYRQCYQHFHTHPIAWHVIMVPQLCLLKASWVLTIGVVTSIFIMSTPNVDPHRRHSPLIISMWETMVSELILRHCGVCLEIMNSDVSPFHQIINYDERRDDWGPRNNRSRSHEDAWWAPMWESVVQMYR